MNEKMNTREHKQYLKEFKEYSREIISSQENARNFLIRTGINTPTGKLTKAYSSNGKK
jgi:hypothetical protein